MRFRRLIAVLAVLALVAVACGDDDATSESTAAATSAATTAETTASTAAPTTTVAETTTTTEAPMTADDMLAELGAPVPDAATLTLVDAIADEEMTIAATVDASPPPNYAGMLDGTDWEVIDVVFGSEATFVFNAALGYCMLVFADYLSPSTPNYWMYFMVWTAASAVLCSEFASAAMRAASERGAP